MGEITERTQHHDVDEEEEPNKIQMVPVRKYRRNDMGISQGPPTIISKNYETTLINNSQSWEKIDIRDII